MDSTILNWLREFQEKKGPFNTVLELGSFNVNGTARDAIMAHDTYIGMDMRPGDGVDVVDYAHNLQHHQEWESYFDCIVATSFFEHDRYFWHTMPGIWGVIKPGGWFVMTIPDMDFPYHPEPHDYWRFTEETVRGLFLQGFKHVEIFHPLWTPPVGHEHLKCQHMGGWGQA